MMNALLVQRAAVKSWRAHARHAQHSVYKARCASPSPPVAHGAFPSACTACTVFAALPACSTSRAVLTSASVSRVSERFVSKEYYSSWLSNVLKLPKGFLTRQTLKLALFCHEYSEFDHDVCGMLRDALSNFDDFPPTEARRIVNLFVFMTTWEDVASFSSEQIQQYLEKWKVAPIMLNDMMSETTPGDLYEMVYELTVDNYYRIGGRFESFYMRWLTMVVRTGFLSRQTLQICADEHEFENLHIACAMLRDLEKGNDEDDEDRISMNANRTNRIVGIFSDFDDGQDALMAKLQAGNVTSAEVNGMLVNVAYELLEAYRYDKDYK